MPVLDMLSALKDIGYNGYVSLEWIKRWSNNLCDAGVVIRILLILCQPTKSRHKHHPLQDNIRKTGKYVWPRRNVCRLHIP